MTVAAALLTPEDSALITAGDHQNLLLISYLLTFDASGLKSDCSADSCSDETLGTSSFPSANLLLPAAALPSAARSAPEPDLASGCAQFELGRPGLGEPAR